MPQSKEKSSDVWVLIESHRQVLTAFFSKRASPQEAEDLMQEFGLRLLLYPPPEPLISERYFVYYVATCVLGQYRERERIDRARYVRGDDAHQHIEGIGATDFISGVDAANELEAILKTLTPRQVKALKLLYCEGLTYKEIAEELRVSVNTIKKDLVSALQHVRSLCYRHRRQS